jgi:transcription antitermination factor NusG
MLEEEIINLKTKHRSISEQIRVFEKKTTSDMGYEVGDNVKVEQSGESATINSVDSTRGMVNIITSAGRSMDVSVDKISSLEGKEKQVEEKNAETEEEKAAKEESKKKD